MTSARSGFWRRFASALVDGILLGIVYSSAQAYVDARVRPAASTCSSESRTIDLPRGLVGADAEEGARDPRHRPRGGGPIGYGRAFIRYIGRIVSTRSRSSLGYFWMIWDKEKQTWHDKFATRSSCPRPIGAQTASAQSPYRLV